MPIYEFYCSQCHMLFSFFSRTVNTEKRPPCPRCKRELERQVSLFAAVGRAEEPGEGEEDLPIDESKMMNAIGELAGQVEGMDEEDPRQAAQLMRRFSKAAGMEFGEGMEEAIHRMESGEDPEAIEAELGDRLENEEPFLTPGSSSGRRDRRSRPPPGRDETLYEM